VKVWVFTYVAIKRDAAVEKGLVNSFDRGLKRFDRLRSAQSAAGRGALLGD
jgi:hypothetical protein